METRTVTKNRFESIQVTNRLIDSVKQSTIVISSIALLPENANNWIFIKHKQYYRLSDVFYVVCASFRVRAPFHESNIRLYKTKIMAKNKTS